jgi:hypothetical protein
MSDQELGKYPLLEAVLLAKGLPIKGVWRIADAAEIFGVRNRAIYDWINIGKLGARDLPGRGRFLSEDFEEFLRNSKRVPKGRNGIRRQQRSGHTISRRNAPCLPVNPSAARR